MYCKTQLLPWGSRGQDVMYTCTHTAALFCSCSSLVLELHLHTYIHIMCTIGLLVINLLANFLSYECHTYCILCGFTYNIVTLPRRMLLALLMCGRQMRL